AIRRVAIINSVRLVLDIGGDGRFGHAHAIIHRAIGVSATSRRAALMRRVPGIGIGVIAGNRVAIAIMRLGIRQAAAGGVAIAGGATVGVAIMLARITPGDAAILPGVIRLVVIAGVVAQHAVAAAVLRIAERRQPDEVGASHDAT